MQEKCNAFVLRKTAFGDSAFILTCFTDKFGLQSFFIRSINNKKNGIRPSHLLIMNQLQIESETDLYNGLPKIKELKCDPIWKNIHTNIYCSTISVFLAELILKTITEEAHPEIELFEFIHSLLKNIDDGEFPLPLAAVYILAQFCIYLGISLTELEINLDHTINELEIKEYLHILHDSSITELKNVKIPYSIRHKLIQKYQEHISRYYMHFKPLKSVSIFESLFQ